MKVTYYVTADESKLLQPNVVEAFKYIAEVTQTFQDRLIERRANYLSHHKDTIVCPKDSPECPQPVAKKSPNVEPNASTTQAKPTSTIPLRVPSQHRNVTLHVEINPLTNLPNLLYSWEDDRGLHAVTFGQPVPYRSNNKITSPPSKIPSNLIT